MSIANKVPALHEFLYLIQTIPHIPSRNIYRLAEHLLDGDEELFNEFFNRLIELRAKIKICDNCCCWRTRDENEDCPWCGISRNQTEICVIEKWIDILFLERAGVFNGMYHVLGGAISPIDGITPDLLSIDLLMQRLSDDKNINELIIATNQTPEGDATATYIERLIYKKKLNISVSMPASGIPVGTAFEFVDKVTIGKAFSNRRKII